MLKSRLDRIERLSFFQDNFNSRVCICMYNIEIRYITISRDNLQSDTVYKQIIDIADPDAKIVISPKSNF